MIGRNEAKTAAAARAIMGETGRNAVSWEIADLSRQDAVQELAGRLRLRCPAIDVLVNNAGAVFAKREITAEGIERTFALNHLAYFTLTLLLLDGLVEAALPHSPARVLCVSSRAHKDARLVLHDLQLERGYTGWRAYANSKLANVLFARALAERVDPEKVIVHALHPGVVATRFGLNNGRRGRLMRRIMDLVSVPPHEGADTLVWLAACNDATHTNGGYWTKRTLTKPSAAARDRIVAESLWERSTELVHVDADALIAAAHASRPRLIA